MTFLSAAPLSAAVVKEASEAAKNYEGKTLYLRKTLNQSRKVYLNVPLGDFYYEHKKGRMFPLREPAEVRIDKVATGDNVKFSLSSKLLGKTEIELKSADGSPITKQAVDGRCQTFRREHNGQNPPHRRLQPSAGGKIGCPFRNACRSGKGRLPPLYRLLPHGAHGRRL
jgi:hypothetical protein